MPVYGSAYGSCPPLWAAYSARSGISIKEVRNDNCMEEFLMRCRPYPRPHDWKADMALMHDSRMLMLAGGINSEASLDVHEWCHLLVEMAGLIIAGELPDRWGREHHDWISDQVTKNYTNLGAYPLAESLDSAARDIWLRDVAVDILTECGEDGNRLEPVYRDEMRAWMEAYARQSGSSLGPTEKELEAWRTEDPPAYHYFADERVYKCFNREHGVFWTEREWADNAIVPAAVSNEEIVEMVKRVWQKVKKDMPRETSTMGTEDFLSVMENAVRAQQSGLD